MPNLLTKTSLSGLIAALLLVLAAFYVFNNQLEDKTPTAPPPSFSALPAEDIITSPKPADLIEQPLDSEEESFSVTATKLDLDNNIYQLAFTLANTSDQDKDFYLIPVSLAHQARFQGIKGSLQGGSASWNFDSGWSFDKEQHKQELIPELAKAYDDIENNNYTGNPIKLTLTPKTTLTAQGEWGIAQAGGLQPVYFLVYGSAGGAKEELTIINVHSHPQQGDNWEVSFTTQGTADLTITPTDQATIDDDEFVSLSCGNEERTPQILTGDVIYYPNWQCPPAGLSADKAGLPAGQAGEAGDGEGKVVHYTKKAGTHTLKFQFGEQTEYAYNSTNNVWSSLGSTDCNVDANWSLGHVPTTGEIAYFDATSVVGCTFSGAITADGLVTVAAYTGAINLNGQTFTLGTGGMVLDNGTGSTFVLGAATIGITNGPLDNRHSTGFNAGTSSITINGTSTLTGTNSFSYYDLTLAAGSTVTTAASTNTLIFIGHIFTINGALTATAAYIGGPNNLDIVINSGATVSGTLGLYISAPTSGHGLITQEGTVNSPIRILHPASGSRLDAGTYGGLVKVGTSTSSGTTTYILVFDNGTYNFNGGLELENLGTRQITLNNATNTPTINVTDLTIDTNGAGVATINDTGVAVNWTITGNVVDERTGNTFVWTKGAGTITFSGGSDQNVNLMGQTVEDVIINKSAGNFVLSTDGNFTTDSFTGTSTGTGDFDPNGQGITVTGNCDWAAAFAFDSAADLLNGSAWDIGGNFTANGQTLNATSAWYLRVHGTAVASGAGAVAYSDASGAGHTAITASSWTNNLNNTNWVFTGNMPKKFTGASTPSDTTSWYREDGWLYRKKITIDNTNVDSDLTNFPLYVFIEGTGSGSSLASKIQDSGQDLRFTDSSGVRTLPHEIESYSEASGNVTAYVWVKVPTVNGSSDTNIYMYYGNSGASDGQDAANVWNSNYKGVWHSKNATTTTISDSTVNVNTGTKLAVGEPVEADGKIAKAQDYDGSNDRVSVGDVGFPYGGSNRTITGWFYNTATTSHRRIFSYGSWSVSKAFEVILYNNNRLGIVGHTQNFLSGTIPISASTWYHFAAVIDGTAIRTYVNAALDINNTHTLATIDSNVAYIGGTLDPGYLMDGIIDEVRISDTARSADWIKFEYNNMNQADNELTWGSEGTSSFTRTRGGIWAK